ncbi:MAG TPA: DUF1343 domain-containing protein, partial [Actinopolymorphaceae bacterium]
MATRRALLASGAVAAGATLMGGAARAEGTTEGAAPGGPGSGGSRVRTGAEVAAEAGWSMLEGSRVGIFSNPTGVLRDTRHIVDDM